MEVLKEIASYETFWYFKGKYYSEKEYREKQSDFFQEIYEETEKQDKYLEEAIYTLKNKEKFSIEERLDNYEKGISIFVEDGIKLPIPRKKWRIKDKEKKKVDLTFKKY